MLLNILPLPGEWLLTDLQISLVNLYSNENARVIGKVATV